MYTVDCGDTPVSQPDKLLSLKFLGYHDIFTLGENVRGETDLVQLEGGYRRCNNFVSNELEEYHLILDGVVK